MADLQALVVEMRKLQLEYRDAFARGSVQADLFNKMRAAEKRVDDMLGLDGAKPPKPSNKGQQGALF